MKNLRQRMIEDMKLRGLTPSTQKRYLDAIEALARQLPPPTQTLAQLRTYCSEHRQSTDDKK